MYLKIFIYSIVPCFDCQQFSQQFFNNMNCVKRLKKREIMSNAWKSKEMLWNVVVSKPENHNLRREND